MTYSSDLVILAFVILMGVITIYVTRDRKESEQHNA